MSCRDVVVVGGSAGGVEAAREFIGGLPGDLPAAVLVVVHMPAGVRSALPQILDRCGALPTSPAEHGQPLKPGHVYVGVPDHHLLIREDTIRLSRSARQNRMRPAVDALFRSAARWTGPRTIGAVLSGALDDGAAGLAAIRARGGVAVVQDPGDAIFDGMPRSALAAVDGDAVLGSPGQLAARITELVQQQVTWPSEPADRDLILETEMAEHDHPNGRERPGRPAGLGCPECNGGLSIVGRSGTEHFHCHVGHTYSPQTLLAAQREKVEAALWTAASFLEEQAIIHQHLAARASHTDATITADNQRAAAHEALRAADTVRRHAGSPATG